MKAMKEMRSGSARERASGGRIKVNVTSAGEERGVFDLTSRDSKTLQLALLLAVTCHCTVPGEKTEGFSSCRAHLLQAQIFFYPFLLYLIGNKARKQ